jgi:thiol-disulfide isomerase/thioredoxin
MKLHWVFCAYLLSVVNVSASDSLTGLNMSHMDAGKPAPAFILPTLEGKLIDSHSLSGQVIILNFWATWCGPCKEEMPSLENFVND